MEPNLHARARAVFDRVVKSDSPITLFHVLDTIIFLAETRHNVANLLPTELFCSARGWLLACVHESSGVLGSQG